MFQTLLNTLNNLQSRRSQLRPPPLFFQEKKVIKPLSFKPSLSSSFILKGQTVLINHSCITSCGMWTDPVWFIHVLEVQICFSSLTAGRVPKLFHFVL